MDRSPLSRRHAPLQPSQWLLRLRAHPLVDLKVVAFGPHLSQVGRTIETMAGVGVDERRKPPQLGHRHWHGQVTWCRHSDSPTPSGGCVPQLIVVTADRYEMLAAASVALNVAESRWRASRGRPQ